MKLNKIVVVLVGNDGTGKSSIANLLNSQQSDFTAIERSIDGYDELKKTINVSQIDELTLKNTFEDRPEDITREVNINLTNVKVFWMLLDAKVETIEQRIKQRPIRDQWETTKALHYFRYRFIELAAYYGIPIIDTSPINKQGVVDKVLELMNDRTMYEEIQNSALRLFDYDRLVEHDLEEWIANNFDQTTVPIKGLALRGLNTGLFKGHQLIDDENDEYRLTRYGMKMSARWFINSHNLTIEEHGNTRELKFNLDNNNDVTLSFPRYRPLLKLRIEGESKKVFEFVTNNPYLKKSVFIVLKKTIYSHSMQATGEIEGLGEIRGRGSQIFLEMIWRNGMKHSYKSINTNGIILSKLVDPIPPTEIVVKKYCAGTDKHSFYNLQHYNESVLSTGEYRSGPYVRFDWRNPNHTLIADGQNVNEHPFYYLVEEYYGKEQFFELFLRDRNVAKPFGDKNISEEILSSGIINTDKTRENVLKMFLTTQHYFSQVGLEIQDVCYMLTKSGGMFWSEINQDCMRIKTDDNSEQFDKDIWRAGGSSSKELIVKKWLAFNDLLMNYFNTHHFADTELKQFNSYGYQSIARNIINDNRLKLSAKYRQIFQKFSRGNNSRRVIVTMDLYNQQPVLVKSGKVFETHSDGDYRKAFEKISIFPDILVVDLNGAFGETVNNRKIVKELATNYYIHSGGGLRTIEDVQDVLESSARRIVISSNITSEFIKQIPKDRLIVEMSINEHDEVLIHGRKTNTHIPITKHLEELALLGVEAISVTFHQTEGHLNGIPREQITQLMSNFPRKIEKVIIAGGISSLDDLEFLWSFEKVIPQLGSAIWSGRLSIGEVYNAMTKFDENANALAIIQDKDGRVKGHAYMNNEAINMTCETRQLHRFSRQMNRLSLKGESSGDYQYVIKMSHDCDNDALLITVDNTRPYCHTGNYSCFSLQTVIKANINTLKDHINSRRDTGSYSGKMQSNPELALAKVMEEFWEVTTASSATEVDECADLIVHLLMYLNGKGISLDAILNELNARRWNPRLVRQINETRSDRGDNDIILAITPSKYTTKTDTFAETELGFKIIRPEGRDMTVRYQITNEEKYHEYFGDKHVTLVTSRPKDMVWLMAYNRIDGAITYNTVVENFPEVYKTIHQIEDRDLRLALIKRKEDDINTVEWTKKNKALIAAEHISHVHHYLKNSGLDENTFSLDRVIGSSEGYMVNNTKDRYTLCDAIVESGKTLDENGLEIWRVVLDRGDVKIGLYLNE